MGRTLDRLALGAAALFFALFAINVIVGKVAVLAGATQAPGVGDVGEFLLLFAAVVSFIAVCLLREARATRPAKQTNVREEGS